MLNDSVELYLQHGWAFDSSAWRSWLTYSAPGWHWTLADRGYTGNAAGLPGYQKQDSLPVAVAHSFGLHLLSKPILARTQLLVIISSFQQFDKRAVRKLRMMATRLKEDAPAVIERFYATCFGEDSLAPPAPPSLNESLLQSDLQVLSNNCVATDDLASIPRIVILHGSKDKVVDMQQAHKLHEMLNDSQLFVHDDAGHALPFTQSDWCLNIIRRELASMNLVARSVTAVGSTASKENQV